jgi:hypothetical protein
MKLLSRTYLRSVPGQLTLLGGVFVGAVVLAAAALVLRGRFFEPFVREKYPPLEGRPLEVARSLAGKEGDPQQRTKWENELLETSRGPDAVYGGLIESQDLDREHRLARWLLGRGRQDLLGRLRRTLTVGNEEQRAGALALLEQFADEEGQQEAVDLVRRARERARRRGEAALVEKADGALARLGAGHLEGR